MISLILYNTMKHSNNRIVDDTITMIQRSDDGICFRRKFIYILVVVPSDLPLRGAEIKDYILVSQPARQMSDRAQNLET